jgi:hypothetical protein
MDDMELWSQMLDQSRRKTVLVNEGQKQIMDSDNYGGRPVIGKIVVLSRSLAEEFQCDKPWACISIADYQMPSENVVKAFEESGKIYAGDMPKISNVNRKAILTLKFDDIEFDRPGKKQIDSNQAEQIFSFVQNIWDDIELLMIHCNAGISRSSAVAKVISEFYQPDVVGVFDQLYQPNPIVQKVVREAGTQSNSL